MFRVVVPPAWPRMRLNLRAVEPQVDDQVAGEGVAQVVKRTGSRELPAYRRYLLRYASSTAVSTSSPAWTKRTSLLDAADADDAIVRLLRRAEPAPARAAPGTDLEVIADADDPDRHRPAQRAVSPPRRDPQLLGIADAVELLGRPRRNRHGRTNALIGSRSSSAPEISQVLVSFEGMPTGKRRSVRSGSPC
jgi:hypothetical protein